MAGNSFTFAKMYEQAHEVYMQRCLQLAKLAVGKVAPNPMVGAVLVHKGQVIAEGYHQQYGGPHAEVHCIKDALQNHPDKITDSTLYVSLEPCAHFGKTPPCADLIVQHKIPEVVIGCRDSFEKVDGKGIAKLKAAGIEVITGVLEKEAIALNKAFFTFHQLTRPYITLKWAQTANGFISGEGKARLMISNDYTNRLVHSWRSGHAAIMVGANTAIADDPLLDNRNWMGPGPRKIVFDPHLKVPLSLRLFNTADVVIILNTIKDAVSGNIIYLKMDKNSMIPDAMRQLHQLNIQSVLVEGGAFLHQSFIEAGMWDEARMITNKELLVNKGVAAPVLSGQAKLKTTVLQNDEIIYFKNQNNSFVHAGTALL
ncbi:bifunctional diaminohydroxyphosphoribosylaminopyrimidine deaminase/5-amino-6-(5-phosphoribosylamino)uracil reductase RibD [Niabella sp. 22666]|uniref:bifunctional diaminohydroxyphosphoribosylaminopyrimidine deaminase/5-amino-6-(5-phosphoribosylamino)uracil reductase RibD n=1 Tax=Niabella sp. 22666 TaxID=3453954 RepID=UPI003F851C0B